MIRWVRRGAKRMLGAFGLDLVRRDRTVVLPRPAPGPPRTEAPGLDWNEAGVAAFLDGPLRRREPEWRTIARKSNGRASRLQPADDPRAYRADNPFFGLADAAVAWTMVRERRPPSVVEVGSGNSTRVLRAALDANGEGTLTAIDPQPRVDVAAVVDEHRAEPVQAVPPAFFADLPPGSLLFIDSSHRGGTGSDVNHLFLEVLPRLPVGTLVHVHDIYLPFDYPTSWNLDRGFLYSEQYLLQALLCGSRTFRVVWPGAWAAERHRAALESLFGAAALGRHCSFWLERVAG